MRLDPDDMSALRAFFLMLEARYWASEPVVDPRVTPTEIARRTGRSRSGVQVRLKRWKDSGFWKGYEVWPNPRLFGAGLATIDVPVRGPFQVDELFDSLRMVDGVVAARDFLCEDGRSVRVYVISDSVRELDRRRRLVARIAGVPSELACQEYWIPETLEAISPLDWRIVALYRSLPDLRLQEAAADLGITPKTLSRRRDRLVDSHALWWLLTTDSAMLSVAAYDVQLDNPSWRYRVKEALGTRVKGWVPFADDGFGRMPSWDLDTVAGLSFVDSPASIDSVAREILEIPGVASVAWKVPRGFRSYPDWLDRAIRAQLERYAIGSAGPMPHPASLGSRVRSPLPPGPGPLGPTTVGGGPRGLAGRPAGIRPVRPTAD